MTVEKINNDTIGEVGTSTILKKINEIIEEIENINKRLEVLENDHGENGCLPEFLGGIKKMTIKKISGLIEPDSDVELLIIQKVNELTDSINHLNMTISNLSEEMRRLKYSVQEIEKSLHSDSHY